MKFAPGVRTVPAGSLQFVDFSKPDPGADRVQRFLTAAQHAIAEGNHALAAQRLIYARDAEPDNTAVLRLMTLAFWQAGNLPAAGRAVRDWARVDGDRPTAHRYAARIYEDMGAIDLAAEAARARRRARARGRRRVGARRPPAAAPDGSRRRDRRARARAPARAVGRRRCSTSRWPTTSPAISAPRSRPASRRRCSTTAAPRRGRAWPTRSRAPTASATRSTPATARCASARTPRSPTSWPPAQLPRVLPAPEPRARACCLGAPDAHAGGRSRPLRPAPAGRRDSQVRRFARNRCDRATRHPIVRSVVAAEREAARSSQPPEKREIGVAPRLGFESPALRRRAGGGRRSGSARPPAWYLSKLLLRRYSRSCGG